MHFLTRMVDINGAGWAPLRAPSGRKSVVVADGVTVRTVPPGLAGYDVSMQLIESVADLRIHEPTALLQR